MKFWMTTFFVGLFMLVALAPARVLAKEQKTNQIVAVTGSQSRSPLWNKTHLVEFDAPGATTVSSPACAPYCGTYAYANNAEGSIVGYYTDKYVVPHAFVRAADGRFLSFDAPGAGLGHGLNEGTVAISINDRSVIAGQFETPHMVYEGFIRSPDGSFVTFSAPGAGTAINQGTYAVSINLDGATAGNYYDAKSTSHGFVRSPQGKFTSFDPAGSVGTYVCQETCLNGAGVATGYYTDAKNVFHGFVRSPDGTITKVDLPGAGTGAYEGTFCGSINANNVVTGYYIDATGAGHGYKRYPNGYVEIFNVPGGVLTAAFSINYFGAVTGLVADAKFVYHGFARTAAGTFAIFDAPGAGTLAGQGTRPSTNNAAGAVTGWWIDKNNLNHGFVWTP